MIEDIKCLLIKLINMLFNQTFEWIIDIMVWVLQLLPETPFVFETIKWGAFGMGVGYFIPIQTMLVHLSYILGALIFWYAIQHIVRVLKIIR